jgi:tripartite-type tricarboxylate transporter receptor subunit TctC
MIGKQLKRLGTAALLVAMPPLAWCAEYPSKTVRVVVGFSAGGGTDIAARAMAQQMSEDTRQQVIVDNRLGASGTIGADIVAKSEPDGHTLFAGSQTTHAVVPQMMPKPPYHPLRDFTPISQMVYSPMLVVVHPSMPVKTIGELIRLAKARPGELNFGAGGIGTTPHMAVELFKLRTGVNMVLVPYKGEAPAIIDVVSGQISLIFGNIPAVIAHIQAGRLRALAITSKERMKELERIPTVSESGVADFEAGSWFAVFGPARMSRELVRQVGNVVQQALKRPAVTKRMDAIGFDVIASSPDEFAKFLSSEYDKWGKVVRAANLKMN